MEKILVIIPAYNEEDTIAEVIFSIKSAYPQFDILVVNDGSTDETSYLAKQTEKALVVDLPFNIGIGGCVQSGFKFAAQNNYDITLQFDGDGQHLISEIEKIILPIQDGKWDCVIGSRFIQNGKHYKPTSFRMMGIWILRFFCFLYTRQRISDQTSGFRSYNRRTINFLAEHYPGEYPEPELIILLGRNGFKMKEVFTEMRGRQGGVSSIPLWKGPYYIIRVVLAMTMAALRSKKLQ